MLKFSRIGRSQIHQAVNNEVRVASALGGEVYGLRCEIRNGPGKSWMRANVYDRLLPFAISTLTAGLFGGNWGNSWGNWNTWANVVGVNQLINPTNIANSIWR